MMTQSRNLYTFAVHYSTFFDPSPTKSFFFFLTAMNTESDVVVVVHSKVKLEPNGTSQKNEKLRSRSFRVMGKKCQLCDAISRALVYTARDGEGDRSVHSVT